MVAESAVAVIRNADLFYSQGRCDDAIILLSTFIARSPGHAEVATRAAELLIDSGRHQRALDYLEGFDTDDAALQASYLCGVCHEALGNFDIAEKIANRIIRQKGYNAQALVLMARIAAFHQKIAEAEHLFQEAVKCDPGFGMAWYGFACLLRKRQGATQTYYDLTKKAFECSPESREIVGAFHESSILVERLAEAETAFRDALCGRWMNRRLRYFLIDLLLRLTKYTEAMSEIESAIVDFGIDEGILRAGLKIRDKLGPINFSSKPKPYGRVSLCMIVKNEKSHLARCLRSAKPVVDEIIIVDTGSRDETKDIARVFGAQVYEFAWDDDFSKARNYSLSKATGEWIFVLDADETISDKDYDKFRRVLETSLSWPAAYRIQTRNYSNKVQTVGFRSNQGESLEECGIGWFPSDKVRLFTNDPRIRFEYPVHELVEPRLQKLKIPVQECTVAIHHFGLLIDAMTRDKTRNYRNLCQKKLRKIKNISVLKELAVQSAQLGNHAEALDLWRRFIKLEPRSAEAYLNMGAACWNLARYAEAVSFSEKAFCIAPSMKEAGFNMAFSMLLMGRAGDAKTTLEKVLGEEHEYPAAQFLMCVALVCLKEMTHAESIFKKLKILPIGDFLGESFLEIARRFLAASRSDYAHRTLEAALHFGCTNSEMKALFADCEVAA